MAIPSIGPWHGRRVYDYESGEYLGRAVGEPFSDGVEGVISLRQDEEGQTIRPVALCAFVVLDGPSDGPTWVEGIGPPLEQIAQDARDTLNGAWTGWQRDVLVLIAEVKRLQGRLRVAEAYIPSRDFEDYRGDADRGGRQ